MRSPDTISVSTNISLYQAATAYAGAVEQPRFTSGVDCFANSYLGYAQEGLKTLITGNPASLAINIKANDDQRIAFLNIDLMPTGGEAASIVIPGFYDEDGDPDAQNGQLARPILRALTEMERLGLAVDLYSIIAQESKSKT